MKNNKLDIVYEDKYLLVINKKENLLIIANDKEKEKTLYHQVSLYLKKKNKNNKVFIVHRLDYETSGLVIFAKTPKVKTILQNNWNNVIRKYIAIVNGVVEKDKGTIESYLKETKNNLVYSINDNKNGMYSLTKYRKVLSNGIYSLLEIEI